MFNIVREDTSLQGNIFPAARRLLPDEVIADVVRKTQPKERKRIFSAIVTVWLCIRKQITFSSARSAEDYIEQLFPGRQKGKRDGNDFCRARARLDEQVFWGGLKHTARKALETSKETWRGLSIFRIDGTTAQLPRTPANVEHFKLASNQHGSSRLPLVRIVLLIAAGVVWSLALGPYATSELTLALQLLQVLPEKSVLLADGLYGSYLNLALAQQRGCHVICKRHVNRRGEVIRQWADGDRLERWYRPHAKHVRQSELLPSLPETMDVRVVERVVHRKGYRDFTLTLFTTLLDREQYPPDDIVALYLRRWDIELDIRTLKEEHGLRRLSARSPEIAKREILSIALAFNIIRLLQAQTGNDPRRLSYRRTCQMVADAQLLMRHAPAYRLPELYKELIAALKGTFEPVQERLPQPRALLQAKRRYGYLNESRSQWQRRLIA